MAEFIFYNISSRDFIRDIARLIEKLYEKKAKLLVLCPDENVVSFFDEFLWAYKKESFIPHSVEGAVNFQIDKIILSEKLLDMDFYDNLIVFKGTSVELEYCNKFEKTYYFFDDLNDVERALARTMWKKALRQGTKCKYWQIRKNKWILTQQK